MTKSRTGTIEPLFFATPAKFRAWLVKNHERVTEQWVGFYRKGNGRPSITWPESVDEALCVGWIDGVRRGLDDERYMIRFTPRKSTSTWSAVNIGRMAVLEKEGRLLPAGIAAFQRRSPDRSGIYAYENRKSATLDPASERTFRANRDAWEFLQAQPPSYRQLVIWRIVTAKKPETRARRLAQLIEHSSKRQRIPPL